MLLRTFLYIDTFLLTNMHSHTPFSHTFFAHMVCFYMCGCLRLPSLLSWLVCAPGRELSIHPSVRQVVYVSVMANCPKPPNRCLTYTLKMICLAISLFSLLYPSFFSLSIHSSFHLSFVPTLSFWQGSTESCNNTEEEEMKGRKGTCPTFTYSACFLQFTLSHPGILSLCWTLDQVEK